MIYTPQTPTPVAEDDWITLIKKGRIRRTTVQQLATFIAADIPGGGGEPGPTGPTGPIGPAGPAGPTGPQGLQGVAGDMGPQGPTGPAGADSVVPGPVGATGPQGLQGIQGTQGIQGVPGAGVVRTVKKLAVDHTNNTVTLSTVTDGTTAWTHSVVSGKSYTFKVYGSYQTIALTTGAKLAVTGSGGVVGTIHGYAWGAINRGAVATELKASLYTYAGAAGAFILTTAVSPINSPHNIGMDFVFNCTTSGTLSIQFATEVAASTAQLNIGSSLIIEEII